MTTNSNMAGKKVIQEIQQAYVRSKLPELLQQHIRGESFSTYWDCAGTLHNHNQIDLVKAFHSYFNSNQESSAYYLTCRKFLDLLPSLVAEIESVMVCILHLYEQSGRQPYSKDFTDSLGEFCKLDSKRFATALALVKGDPERFSFFLISLLTITASPTFTVPFISAIELTGSDSSLIRDKAVLALGQLPWIEDDPNLKRAFDIIKKTSDGSGQFADRVCGIQSGLNLLISFPGHQLELCSIMSSLLEDPTPEVCEAASTMFAVNSSNLPEPLFNQVVDIILSPSNLDTQTLSNIDLGLSHLFTDDAYKQGISVLERLLTKLDSTSAFISDLKHCFGQIAISNGLDWVISRFLSSGEPMLCAAVQNILSQIHGPDVVVNVPDEFAASDSVDTLFLARKAIGYLFEKPVTAASIIISLLRRQSKIEVIDQLAKLLFYPLLISYPGKVREYLLSVKMTSDMISMKIDELEKKTDAYFNSLSNYSSPSEILPTVSQRYTHQKYFSKLSLAARKEGEKKSFWMQFSTKSVILYGLSSVIYTTHPDGASRRNHSELKPHEYSYEMPRLFSLDPVGLNRMLWFLRNERHSG